MMSGNRISRSFVTTVCLMSVISMISAKKIICEVTSPCKINEIPQRPVSYRICGDTLKSGYDQVCSRKRGRRNVLLAKDDLFWDEQIANSFLSMDDDIIGKRRTFNAHEECCKEGCVKEELQEYCE